MRKTYESPKLTVHGSVQLITGRFGDPTQADAIFFGGQQVGSAQGSIDACATQDHETCL